jgi:MFS family permease
MEKNIEKIKEKEAGELSRWTKAAAMKPYAGYAAVMIVMLSLIRILDEFITSAPSSLQTSIVTEFFVEEQGMDFNDGLSQFSLIGTFLMFFIVFSFIYTSRADIFGRKRMLLISVMGMIVGAFLAWLSPNFTSHMVARVILTFFLGVDIHNIYIMETAPDGKRATYVSVAAFFGYLSMMLVSVSRNVNTVDGALDWRGVFLLPTICGVVLFILLALLGRETKTFLNRRIAKLSIPYEERLITEKAAKEKVKDGSIFSALKYLFKHKQTRYLVIMSLCYTPAVLAFFGYYEPIMTTSGMSTEAVTDALFIYPLVCALISLGAGFLADKIGRKPVCILCAVLAFAGLIAFVMAARSNVNPYVVGVLFGIELGSFWAFGNTLTLMTGEITPTEIRASAGAARGFLQIVLTLISSVVLSILIGKFDLGMLCLVWGAVTLGLGTIVLIIKVRETKGADLDNVVSD